MRRLYEIAILALLGGKRRFKWALVPVVFCALTPALHAQAFQPFMISGNNLPASCTRGYSPFFYKLNTDVLYSCGAGSVYIQVGISSGTGMHKGAIGAQPAECTDPIGNGFFCYWFDSAKVIKTIDDTGAISTLGAGGGGGVTINTAGIGWVELHPTSQVYTLGVALVASANQVKIEQWVNYATITASQLTVNVVTVAGAAKALTFKIFDSGITTVLATFNAVSGGSPDINTTGPKNIGLLGGGTVTFAPGIYWVAVTTDSAPLELTRASDGYMPDILNSTVGANTSKTGFCASAGTVATGSGSGLTFTVANCAPGLSGHSSQSGGYGALVYSRLER